MSKKNRKNRQQEDQAAVPEVRPVEMVPGPDGQTQQPRQSAAAEPQRVPQDRKYFFIFWGIVVLAAAVAWILAIVMPSVSESIIERWIMAALALSLAVFLFVYK